MIATATVRLVHAADIIISTFQARSSTRLRIVLLIITTGPVLQIRTEIYKGPDPAYKVVYAWYLENGRIHFQFMSTVEVFLGVVVSGPIVLAIFYFYTLFLSTYNNHTFIGNNVLLWHFYTLCNDQLSILKVTHHLKYLSFS